MNFLALRFVLFILTLIWVVSLGVCFEVEGESEIPPPPPPLPKTCEN